MTDLPLFPLLPLNRYVKNLADDVDDDGLRKLAEEFGEVQSAVIMRVSVWDWGLRWCVWPPAKPAGAAGAAAVWRAE
jgi:hypothetical protein